MIQSDFHSARHGGVPGVRTFSRTLPQAPTTYRIPVNSTVALSAALGLGLASANLVVSLLVLRRSMGLPSRQFIGRVMGSLGLRMLALFVLVTLVLWLTEVDALAFGLAFVVAVAVGLVAEMWILLRWTKSAA